jgi:hypothetical protein
MKPITLALQCSDPPIRLTGTFPPTATLTEVLLHFEQESNGQLVIFGRRGEEAVLSVLGREFGITEGSGGGGTTTLAGMGVGGNVLVRLGFRKIGSTMANTSIATTSSSISNVAAAKSSVHSIPVSFPETSRSSTHTSSTAPESSHSSNQALSSSSQKALQSVSSPPPREVFPEVNSESISSPAGITPPSLDPSPDPPVQPAGPSNRNRKVYTAASASTPTAAKRNTIFESKLILVDSDDSVYNMTTEQAKSYQAYLASNAKAYSERTLMTREMREAADREKANKHAFAQVTELQSYTYSSVM